MRVSNSSISRLLTSAMLLVPAIQGTVTDKVHNEKVSAVEITLRPGETEVQPSKLPAVLVFFQKASFQLVSNGVKPANVFVEAGEARYVPANSGAVRNSGESELHFARVNFTGEGGPETWGTSGLAPHYKLLHENRYGRVYDIRIPAHTNEPQHTHKDRIVVCLSGAKLMHRFPDGREEPSTLKTGEIVWRKGGTHIGQNLGDTDLWAIAVEPK